MNPILIWLILPKETHDEMDAALGDALLHTPTWPWVAFIIAPIIAFDVWALWTLLK